MPAPVVICSELAHESVRQAWTVLGFGEYAVRIVPVDGSQKMRMGELRSLLCGMGGHTLVAVVATAGTTDFGSIDPLRDIAEITTKIGVWLHMDAAYGRGARFSAHRASCLAGLAGRVITENRSLAEILLTQQLLWLQPIGR